MPFVHDYMTIWFAGIIFMVGPMIASNILRALGDAILPSIIMILAAVLNMILDPILIFGLGPIPAMEVQGAALATLISNLVVFVVAMGIMIFREKIIDLSWPGFAEMAPLELGRDRADWCACRRLEHDQSDGDDAGVRRCGSLWRARWWRALGWLNGLKRLPLFRCLRSPAPSAPSRARMAGPGMLDRVREAFRSAFMFWRGLGCGDGCVAGCTGLSAVLAVPAVRGRAGHGAPDLVDRAGDDGRIRHRHGRRRRL